MAFSKIKHAVLYQKRARMSYFLYPILTAVLSFIIINIFTSIYVNFFPGVLIKQPVSRLDDFGFSISNFYGLVYSSFFIICYFIFILCDIQRLRDIGYRHPITISLLLMFLTFTSYVLSALVKMNFISIFIDVGLLVFYLMMLFTASKSVGN